MVLQKSKGNNEIQNGRPIAIQNAQYKLLQIVLLRLIEGQAVNMIDPAQAGNRKGFTIEMQTLRAMCDGRQHKRA